LDFGHFTMRATACPTIAFIKKKLKGKLSRQGRDKEYVLETLQTHVLQVKGFAELQFTDTTTTSVMLDKINDVFPELLNPKKSPASAAADAADGGGGGAKSCVVEFELAVPGAPPSSSSSRLEPPRSPKPPARALGADAKVPSSMASVAASPLVTSFALQSEMGSPGAGEDEVLGTSQHLDHKTLNRAKAARKKKAAASVKKFEATV